MLLSQKASEAEQEITRIRLNNMKTEEEKVHLERKTREAELLTERLVQESERRAAEAEKLKDELLRARIAEKEAKEKLLEFLSRNAYSATIPVSMNLFVRYEITSTNCIQFLSATQHTYRSNTYSIYYSVPVSSLKIRLINVKKDLPIYQVTKISKRYLKNVLKTSKKCSTFPDVFYKLLFYLR